jgi:predicted molibdopterin-dependent oxidoreductase YjgC
MYATLLLLLLLLPLLLLLLLPHNYYYYYYSRCAVLCCACVRACETVLICFSYKETLKKKKENYIGEMMCGKNGQTISNLIFL